MELDAFDRKLPVAEAHDDAVGGFGGNFQAARERAAFDDERMVARGFEILREAAKNRLAVVMNFAGFAVHDFFRADDFAAERIADGLMAEANTEDGNFAGEALDDGHAQAGFARRARAGRNNDALRAHARDFVESDFVVAAHGEFLSELAEVLRQVVSERIVVVDEQNHVRALVYQLCVHRVCLRIKRLAMLSGRREKKKGANCLSLFNYRRRSTSYASARSGDP